MEKQLFAEPEVKAPVKRSRGRVRARLTAVLALAMAAALPLVVSTRATADAPNLVSRNGINVSAVRWISPRTLEADISTALISANAVNGPHRIRVTLPNDYFQRPTVRYPVVYLLHGGAGGNSAQWTTGGGAAEQITNGKPVITVMADGGKVGWFTNWVKPGNSTQKWLDFYINQVIPWTDGNLRTVAAKNGRAIAGLSMGGFGAIRIAQARPDLFGSVASFSGALNLDDFGTRTVIWEQSIQNGFPGDGPFGSSSSGWNAANPMKRPEKLKGVQVLLYAGSGIHDADVLERTMGWSTHEFAQKLVAAGVPHFWWMYGRPGPSVPYGCDGGHNFSCWNFSFNDALPRMLSVLATPTPGPTTTVPPTTAPPTTAPPSGNIVVNPGFESGMAPWACLGQCGRDAANLGRTGAGNGWVRNNTGWNDLHQTVSVAANRTYRVTGWIRTSTNNADGYFGLRTGSGAVVGERRFGSLGGYTQVSVDVNTGSNTSLVLYAGLWANGDTWAQIDDVSVTAL